MKEVSCVATISKSQLEWEGCPSDSFSGFSGNNLKPLSRSARGVTREIRLATDNPT